MLALMAELERQGPAFASRTLITVIGVCTCLRIIPALRCAYPAIDVCYLLQVA